MPMGDAPVGDEQKKPVEVMPEGEVPAEEAAPAEGEQVV